jgi:hypothetical protein
MTDNLTNTISLPLGVQLTPAELELRGNEHRMTLDRLDALEARAKAMREEIKYATEFADCRERELRGILSSGKETREVTCEESPDYEKRQWVTRRLDTYEQVKSRPMSEKELQINIKDFASPGVELRPHNVDDVSRFAPATVTDLDGSMLDPDWIAVMADGSRAEVTQLQIQAWRNGSLFQIDGVKITNIENIATPAKQTAKPAAKPAAKKRSKRENPMDRIDVIVAASRGDESPNLPDFGTPDAPIVIDEEDD